MRVLAISPGDGRDLRPWIDALGAAGLPALLLREPHLGRRALAALADHAASVIPTVILHDRNPAARSLHRPLHLPSDAGSVPTDRPFGVSCHRTDDLDAAFTAGASWALLSPVFPPRSKPDDRRPTLGIERFLALAADRPVLALGGLDLSRAEALLSGGAYGIAAIDLFFGSLPTEAARRCARLMRLRGPEPVTPRR